MSQLGRNFYKLHVEQEINTLNIWLKTRAPRYSQESVKRNFSKSKWQSRECKVM